MSSPKLVLQQTCLGIWPLGLLRLVCSRCFLGGRLSYRAGMLVLLRVLLVGNLLRRHWFYLRCFSLSLFGRRLRGLGFLRVLVGVRVMSPERDL